MNKKLLTACVIILSAFCLYAFHIPAKVEALFQKDPSVFAFTISNIEVIEWGGMMSEETLIETDLKTTGCSAEVVLENLAVLGIKAEIKSHNQRYSDGDDFGIVTICGNTNNKAPMHRLTIDKRGHVTITRDAKSEISDTNLERFARLLWARPY